MKSSWNLVSTSVVAMTMAPLAHAGGTQPYGVPGDVQPNHNARTIHALLNAARMAPAEYDAQYLGDLPGILEPANYPPIHPLIWTWELIWSSGAHADDIANTPGCPYGRDSCDGTPWATRLAGYYSGSALELLGAGFGGDPLTLVNVWLEDGGALDYSGADTLRRLIMDRPNPSYTPFPFYEIGAAYVEGANPFTHYWVADVGNLVPAVMPKVVGGSHMFDQPGTVTFMANYFDPGAGAPQQAQLILDRVATPLSLDLGAADAGTYAIAVPQVSGVSCRQYLFRFQDAAGNWHQLPEQGAYLVTGEGACSDARAYVDICQGDLNGDEAVNVLDLLDMLTAWGPNPGHVADLNFDGAVNVSDLLIMLAAWGPC